MTGTCSRDEDGSVYCTKPSYSNPQYNLTHVQGNSVFFPDMIHEVIKRKTILALIALNSIGYVLFAVGSFPFWFPRTTSRMITKDGEIAPSIAAIVFLVLSFVAQFFTNFSVHVTRIGLYNSIDNFYLPAACGETRQLRPGVLLRASNGKSYNMLWVGWCLIFIFALSHLVYRAVWISSKFDNAVADVESCQREKAEKKREKSRLKEEERFRKRVEKEKIAIAARAELDAEKKSNEEKTGSSISDSSSIANAAPPYLPLDLSFNGTAV